jgi:hypothetical protein
MVITTTISQKTKLELQKLRRRLIVLAKYTKVGLWLYINSDL